MNISPLQASDPVLPTTQIDAKGAWVGKVIAAPPICNGYNRVAT